MDHDNFSQGQEVALFAEVILPLALPVNYTYRIPPFMTGEVSPGKRVAVQFGKSRIYSALVRRVTDSFPARYAPKEIIQVLDDSPIVSEKQFLFWEWMAAYYLCSTGEVMTAALPASLKLSSQTRIILNRETAGNKLTLNEKESLVHEALQNRHELTVNEVAKLLGIKTVMPLIKSLIDKKIVYVSEQIVGGYKPRTSVYLQLDPVYTDTEKLRELYQLLDRAPRQLDALMTYVRMSGRGRSGTGQAGAGISKKELQEESGVSAAVINSLIEKEVFIPITREVSRLQQDTAANPQEYRFSPAQEEAFNKTQGLLETMDTVLLHGVTASGKTLIYIKLIESCLEKGLQVLYLLPEIAITEQMTRRLSALFGDRLVVYHSRFSDNERGEIWQKVRRGDCPIVVGARSALFLPFERLGLVIVDEEHENSFKQFDPAPRYHARDSALYLAGLFGARTVLGSATPSLESYYNARSGKYGLVKLQERYLQVMPPETIVVDMLRENRKKTAQAHFSALLLEEIRTSLANKKQVILFRNRRGYVPLIICQTCGYVPQCMNCDISLTYHRSSEKLVCHYCGYSESLLATCPACGSMHLSQKGFGTEKVEDELQILLPKARIARLDLDNTRSKNAFQQILNDFEDGNIDVLVGTQMVTKGLDFSNVNLVGILDADALFRYPDFRAFERSYQLMLQVSGRAGRREQRGKVIIQTASPRHEIINMVLQNNYENFYASEIEERRQFKYPPFYRLINVHLKHKNEDYLAGCAAEFASLLKSRLGNRVLGPQIPLVARVRNQYLRTLLIKMDREKDSISKVKEIFSISLTQLRSRHKGLVVQADADPL